ncbi:MAG: flagellar protein [Eubacterium sp.]|jgi:predicted amidophosphoribosyltransferase|nr:flagellar protein [Eubacterium sp.]
MDVRTCKSCKRLFNYLSGPVICPSCVEKLEEKFKEVKDFIRENPHSSLKEVSEAKEVSVKQLKNWVREERLRFADDSPVGIECMNCGAMIKYGKYCEACKGKMINNLSHAVEEEPVRRPEPKKSDGNRMRFLDT